LNLGVGTSGIGSGTFSGNLIQLELHTVDGPGHVALFTASSFGAPIAHWASRDGLRPETDSLTVPAVNGHMHVNWAFTEPGTYRLALAASATLTATGQTTRSPLVDFTFVVEGPVRPQLEISGIQPDGSAELQFVAPATTSVIIEAATELGRWIPIGTVVATGQPQKFTIPGNSLDLRFFRAVLP
jgi:surface-anchored protein